jgi:hypothetical protein
MDCVKIFDFFGYTPQFLIQNETNYRSRTGGLISLFFILISIFYTLFQFYNFFSKIDVLQSSRNVIQPSNMYTLTTKDLYFGVGLIDRHGKEYNISLFPYMNFELDYLYTDKDTMNETRLNLKMGPCDISKFLLFENYDNLTLIEKEKLNKKIPYYLCPQGDFNFKMSSFNIIEGDIYIQVSISITNTSVLADADLDLGKKLIKTNFIYRNMFINIENRRNPYSTFIENYFNSIDYKTEITQVIYLDPLEMADDNDLIRKGEFNGIISPYSNQPNQTIFLPSPGYNYISMIKNRSDIMISNDNKPLLSLCNIKMILSPVKTITMRSYTKFTDFFAGLTSIMSTVLMAIAIFMVHFNSVEGFNEMVESFYSHDSIKNISFFNRDLKECIQKYKLELSLKVNFNI